MMRDEESNSVFNESTNEWWVNRTMRLTNIHRRSFCEREREVTGYFDNDYIGVPETDVTTEWFLEGIERLISDLPEDISLCNLEFGMDHFLVRGDYDDPGYYLVYVSERG